MTPALRQNLTLAVLVLTGINMRPLLTSIGPVLPDIPRSQRHELYPGRTPDRPAGDRDGVLALAAGWVDRYIGQSAVLR